MYGGGTSPGNLGNQLSRGTTTTIVVQRDGTESAASHSPSTSSSPISVLQLTERPERRRVEWSEDVIDNEGIPQRKSKKCCIFHKRRPYNESSSESDSDHSSFSEDTRERRRQKRAQRKEAAKCPALIDEGSPSKEAAADSPTADHQGFHENNRQQEQVVSSSSQRYKAAQTKAVRANLADDSQMEDISDSTP